MPLGLNWREELAPEMPFHLPSYRYTVEDWAVMVSYQFLAPKLVVYEVVIAGEVTRFHWQGEVDAAGRVGEKVAPS